MPSFGSPQRFRRLAQEDFGNFGGQDLFRQLSGRLGQGQFDPGSLVFQAGQDADVGAQLARSRSTRNRSRYGVAATPGSEVSSELGATLGRLDALNRAQGAQNRIDDGLLESLANFGTRRHGQGLGALGQAAGFEQQRVNTDRQRRADRYSRNVGIGTSLAIGAAKLI